MSEVEEKIRREPGPVLGPAPKPARRPSLERSFGLIAGILFIGGSLAGIPSSLLIDPPPPASLYLVTVAGIAFGLGAMTIHWERIASAWTHVAMVAAIIEVGICVALAGDPFVFYFVFIAIFAAYAFSDRNQVAIYLGLIGVALLLPIVVIPDSTRATAAQALAAVPAIGLVTVMVVFLRERLEANRATTRRFAREALALSERIGRAPASPPPIPLRPAPAGLAAHPGWRRLAVCISVALVAIAATGTMAAAGVALPDPIRDSFASVGIEHKNDPAPPKGPVDPAHSSPVHAGGAPAAPSPRQASPATEPRTANHRKHRKGDESHEAGNAPAVVATSGAQTTSTPGAGSSTGQADSAAQAPDAAPVSQAPSAAATQPPAVDPPVVSAPNGDSPAQQLGQQLGDQIGSLVDGLLDGDRRP